MDRYFHICLDDNLITLMERIAFNLMEMGIKVEVMEATDEFITYRLVHAEPLPPENK